MSRNRYMTYKQPAEYLGIRESALYKLVQRRRVPYGKRGRRLIYDKVRLDDWAKICHKQRGVTVQEAVRRHLRKGHLY